MTTLDKMIDLARAELFATASAYRDAFSGPRTVDRVGDAYSALLHAQGKLGHLKAAKLKERR